MCHVSVKLLYQSDFDATSFGSLLKKKVTGVKTLTSAFKDSCCLNCTSCIIVLKVNFSKKLNRYRIFIWSI